MNFVNDVLESFKQNPQQQALHWLSHDQSQHKCYTFSDILHIAAQIASVLQIHDLKKGDRILLMMPNIPQWWTIMMGLTLNGSVPVPATIQLTTKDIRYRLQAANIKAVITTGEQTKKFELLQDEFGHIQYFNIGKAIHGWKDWDALVNQSSGKYQPVITTESDPALLYFTSGTTGEPKMVLHNQSYAAAHRVTGEYWLNINKTDKHWCLSDPGWAKAAWSSLYAPWNMGACIFAHESRGKFQPEQVLSILSREKITSFCAPPTIYRMLIQHTLSDYDLSSLQQCVAAGEPLNPEVIGEWQRQTDLLIRDGYGQTESVLQVGNFIGEKVKPGSMGKAVPIFSMAVVDNQGCVVPTSQEGHLAIKVKPHYPCGLFTEYVNNPEENKRRFVGDWYLTGDRVTQDDDGYFWFVARDDDVIISAGYRIGPFEVESALLEHPAVIESAVVAKPDPERGAIVKAYCVLAKSYCGNDKLIQELQTHVKSVTAPYKYPREIEFVENLPKTISGKIQRVVLREKMRHDTYEKF